jgi:hypothetical protein
MGEPGSAIGRQQRDLREVELIALSPGEVAGLLSQGGGGDIRGHRCAAADLVPEMVARAALARYQDGEEWFWCAPRLFHAPSLGLLVGSGCFKNAPIAQEVEIGYGVAAACEGRGYGTAGVACLVQEAFTRPAVVAVTAETSPSNRGSERVLEKNGFLRAGARVDADEGALTLWRRERDRKGAGTGAER